VLVLVGPSVVTATCELTCAMASHHRSATTPTEAPCHEHQDAMGVRVAANPSTLCHESGDLPSAVLDVWLTTVVLPAAPATTVVVAPVITVTSIVRAHEPRAVFDPRPTHRPLRV
jgi:hypothetical protein